MLRGVQNDTKKQSVILASRIVFTLASESAVVKSGEYDSYLDAWWNQAITSTRIDFPLLRFGDFPLSCIMSLNMIMFFDYLYITQWMMVIYQILE